MERIREAIRMAKAQRKGEGNVAPAPLPMPADFAIDDAREFKDIKAPPELRQRATFKVDRNHLEANRIIASQIGNPQAGAFDMLRTKVLQEMDEQGWQVLVMTSPSVGCGKTMSSINLALSIARQPDRSVYLVDLDFRKPKVAFTLGATPEYDISNVIKGECDIEDAMFNVDIAGPQLTILANRQSIKHPSEAIASRQVKGMFDYIKSEMRKPVIVVDMPPVLITDDVLAFLPQADCCILAVAEGISTISDVDSSEKLLTGTNYLGCILTKSSERALTYY
jgi:protein-tyrosine kinase